MLPTPAGVTRVDVETAREMLDAVEDALPADVAILVAAVADWRAADEAPQKIKKDGHAPAPLLLEENPDILATLAGHPQRPGLLIGFAAETRKSSITPLPSARARAPTGSSPTTSRVT